MKVRTSKKVPHRFDGLRGSNLEVFDEQTVLDGRILDDLRLRLNREGGRQLAS